MTRNSQRAVVKLSRALRAEALEGRMMLSAASPVLSSVWHALQVGGELDEQTSLPAQHRSIAVITPIEGGYVFGDRLATTAGSALFLGNANLDSSVSIADLIHHDPLGPASVTLRDWSIYDVSANGGFIGRVIAPGPIAQPSQPINEPDPNGNADDWVSSEGGLLSINPIPGASDQINETGRTDSALTRSLGKPPTSGMLDSNGAASAFRSISGEWARAAVFEIAGGEPADRLRIDDGEPVAVTDPFVTTESTDESAATELSRYEARRAGQETTVEADAELVSATAEDIESSPPSADVSVSTANGANVFAAQWPIAVLMSERAPRAGSTVKAVGEPSDVAVEAAFDKIGEGEFATPMSSNDRVRLDWLSGAPLLLMLALEHIAARNSRRQRASQNAVSISRPYCR